MSQSGILADLALRISANTSELQVGLQKAQSGINKFSKEAKEKSKAVGEGFNSLKEGVASMTSSISGKLGEVTGGLADLAGAIPAVITGIKGATTGMNLFKVALAGTGIGLLVIALASLISYFMNTKEGADMLSKAMAGIKAVVDVVIDTFSDFGGVIIKAIKDPMGTLKSFGDAIKNFIMSKIEQLLSGIKGLGTALKLLFAGEFKKAADVAVKSAGDIVKATSPIAWGLEAVGAAVDGVKKKYGEASKEAKKAIQFEREAQKLRQEQQKFALKESETEAKIAELRKKMSMEIKYTAKQRNKFLDEAQKLEEGLGKQRIKFREEELRIHKGISSLSNDSNESLAKTNELQVAVNNAVKEYQDKLEEIEGKRVEITDQGKGELEDEKKKTEEKHKQLMLTKQVEALKVSTPEALKVSTPKVAPIQVPLTVQPVDPNTYASFTALKEVLTETGTSFQELQSFSDLLNLLPVTEQVDALSNKLDQLIPTSESVGEALGKAAEQFSSAVMQAASDGASSLGDFVKAAKDAAKGIIKSLIAEGVAYMVKSALQSASFMGPVGLALAPAMAAGAGALANAAFSSLIPGFANGGKVPGGLTIVGERGPELVNLPSGSNVTRANKTEQLLSGGTNINVNVTGHLSGETIHFASEEYKRRNGNRY